MTRVAAVIPVLDEAEAIGPLIAGLRLAGCCCAIVVDGGSADGTADAAEEAGGTVVHEPRRGYGRACLTGTERALAPAADGHLHEAVAFLDGDGSCDPADLPRLVAALADADVVLGRRPSSLLEPGAMPWHARFGNRLVAWMVRVRSGRRVRDLPPFKVINRLALGRIDADDERYGWTVQVIARAAMEPTLRIREIPVAFRVRRGGTSKVSGSWLASCRAARQMIATALRETRVRPVVGLMAKAPGSGQAKTRLAVDLGPARTADLWTAFLGDVAGMIAAACRAGRCQPLVMVANESDIDPIIDLIGPAWTPVVQRRAGLAAAIGDVFLAAFDRGADRALAVAGDVPSMPPSRIADALAALGGASGDAVLGPSRDGGYHLVGLSWRGAPRWWPARARRRRRAQLAMRLGSAFDAVPMGDATALASTTKRLADAGWVVALTAPWPDIDTLDDLRRHVHGQEGDADVAPRTAAWVQVHWTSLE